MKNRSLTILLSFVFCLIAPTVSFAARYGTVQGSIFTDTNGNNVLDRTEKGGGAAIVWLYRVLPNGAVQRVR